jgi:hypothetical protein
MKIFHFMKGLTVSRGPEMTETKEKLGNTKNSFILGPKLAEF